MYRIITTFVLIFSSINLFSQFEMGVKTGLSSTQLVSEGIFIKGGENDSYELNVENVNYGFHFGLYTRLSIANIYLEPSFLLNSSNVDFRLDEFQEDGIFSSLQSENYQHLDIPILLGFKMGPLRFQGGPVAHIYVNNTSELTNIKGYEEKFKTANYGIQLGAGLDIWRFRLDCNYEGNLSKFGEHITVDGNQYAFSSNASRIVASLGYAF